MVPMARTSFCGGARRIMVVRMGLNSEDQRVYPTAITQVARTRCFVPSRR
jgi:hypothetical protein